MKKTVKDIPRKDIKLTKNHPPIPDIAKIVFSESEEILNITFRYFDQERKDGKEIMEWIMQYSEAVTGRPLPPKETLVFDGEFYVGECPLYVFNMLLKNTEFYDVDSDDQLLEMEISYEHFYWGFPT